MSHSTTFRPVNMLSVTQLLHVQETITRLGGETLGLYTLLAHASGQDLAYWCRFGKIDSAEFAALIAAKALSSRETGDRLGAAQGPRVIVQEFERWRLLLCWVDSDHILALVTEPNAPLGLARIWLQRCAKEIQILLNAQQDENFLFEEFFVATLTREINALPDR